MNRPGGTVITFPTWRRQVMGAPGVGDAPGRPGSQATGAIGDESEQPPTPDASEVHGTDTPVWHEGTTPTGRVLLRMRIDIVGAHPPVWRRLEVHGDLTLDRFHHVLIAAFGWPTDAYFFRDLVRTPHGHRVGVAFQNRFTPARLWPGPDEREVRLDQALREPGDRLRYTYQRRGPQLTIAAEDVMPRPPETVGDVPPARCLTARRSAPQARDLGLWRLQTRNTRRGGPPLPNILREPWVETDGPVDLGEIDRRVRSAAESDPS